MMHLILVIAVVFVFAASCLLTFALCRAATRRDLPGVQPPRTCAILSMSTSGSELP